MSTVVPVAEYIPYPAPSRVTASDDTLKQVLDMFVIFDPSVYVLGAKSSPQVVMGRDGSRTSALATEGERKEKKRKVREKSRTAEYLVCKNPLFTYIF